MRLHIELQEGAYSMGIHVELLRIEHWLPGDWYVTLVALVNPGVLVPFQ